MAGHWVSAGSTLVGLIDLLKYFERCLNEALKLQRLALVRE